MRAAVRHLVLVMLGCLSHALAQGLPSFCGPPVSPLFARDLADPYGKLTAPDGSEYCEGTLPHLARVSPSEIISVKQVQPADVEFVKSGSSAITWCSDPSAQGITHVRLRALSRPEYGLDAEHAGKFEWASDRISKAHARWADLAALGTQTAKIQNQDRTVVVPLRLGDGYSSTYSFLISSEVKLPKALIEWPGGPKRQTKLVEPRPVVVEPDKTIDKKGAALWEVTLSFPSTRVDVEVRLNGLTVTMQPGGSDSLIAGERGEVLALKTARISGDTMGDFAFDVDPASIDSPRFEQMSIPAGKPCTARRPIGTGSQTAVGTIPEKDTPCGPSTLRIELAFDKGARGIALEASGSQPATASLNTGTDFSSGSASGNKLRVELYPATGQKSIVVARNLPTSGVTYELDGETSVLGGKIFVQSHLSQEIPIRSGDRLQIDTDEPAYVREMSLADGEIADRLDDPLASQKKIRADADDEKLPRSLAWGQYNSRWPASAGPNTVWPAPGTAFTHFIRMARASSQATDNS